MHTAVNQCARLVRSGTVAPHPHVLVTTHCCLCRLTHAPFAATLAGGSRRTNVLFS